MNNLRNGADVPRFDDEKLVYQFPDPGRPDRESADQEHRHRPVRHRTSKVRPRLDENFKRDEKMGIYVQFYNFEHGRSDSQAERRIEYEIVKNGSNQKVFEFTEEVSNVQGASPPK